MLKQKTNKNGSFAALISISVLLLLIILLENISDRIPGLPAVFLPTSQLFTVLKKGAVYSLVAVSMNLLNGFTGLFSLGQAGFMLLGAYTYAILTVPMALRVIRIAETLSASAETRGIDLTRRKSNYLSLRFSAWDVVFCVLLAASIAAGLIL